jgi:hypothetical protein
MKTNAYLSFRPRALGCALALAFSMSALAAVSEQGWRLEQAVGAAVPFPVPQERHRGDVELQAALHGQGPPRAGLAAADREKGGALSRFAVGA